MKTRFSLLFVFALMLLFYNSGAQKTTSAAGGNLIGTGGSISFTVGQVTNLYLSDIKGSVAQGVQQPYEIFLVTGIAEAKGINLDLQLYPNPVQDFLKLKIQGLNTENLVWKIHDANGKLLKTDRISAVETSISMANYTSGVYLFSILNNNNLQYKTYRIIKN